MCGVVGVFDRTGRVDPGGLERAVGALHHRGPDGHTVWVDDTGLVGLGHSRLSVIDLHTGRQPVGSEDGRVRAVVNGEFYGYEAIRRQLEECGHVFRTQSDSEILVHLYEAYGFSCLEHLRGEFAFVLWDERNQLLFCARDRFGVKPLFTARRGDVFCAASEVKALRALVGDLRWDLGAVHEALYLGVPTPARTLFQDVGQVRPGHYLVVTAGTVRERRYWAPTFPPQVPEDGSVETLQVALDEAVRVRLRADIPVGVYLSGGLDSAAVLALAARHSTAPLDAFTLSFAHPDYDEVGFAAEVAERTGARLNIHSVTSTDLADDFSDAVFQAESLLKNSHGVARFGLSRAARRAGVQVVLTGEGADELLGGYPPFRRDMLLHGVPPSPEADALLRSLDADNEILRGILVADSADDNAASAVAGAAGFVPSYFQAQAAAGQRLTALCSFDFLASYSARDAHQLMLSDLDAGPALQRWHPLNRSLWFWSQLALPGYLLPVLGDRAEMAHGVEGRVPFLDDRVVQAAASLPADLKVRGATGKYALREAVRELIPRRVYERPKHPFLAPPAVGGDPLWLMMQDIVRSQALDALPFFDTLRVRRLFDRLHKADDAERIALDPVACVIVSACLLQKRFGL